VAVVSHDPWDPAWAPTLPAVVPAPHLSVQDRATLWRSHLSDEPSEGDPSWQDLLALRVTPEEVDAVADLVRGEHGEATVALLRDASRRLSGRGAAAVRPRATLEDLVLPAEVASGVRQLLAWARHRDQVLAQGPLMGKGKGAGITALFTGSPGTGKTLAANVIADSLGVDLYQVDLSGVVDKYVGETEKNLERVFRAAERLNCVLFFDEADSLFGSRSEVRDSRDRYANLEVSYLLQRMEQFDGIAVLATNLRGNLDVAFSRRLHFVLHFPDPDETTRAALWRQHLRHLAATDPQDPVDVEHLARVAEVAGGDIRNAVLAAAFTAADEGVPVGMRHVVGGLEREYRKLGRRVTAGGLAPRGA
ncbi:MAG: ATP-binding protein, partial [Motilibacteraceae bacterium]